MIIRRGQLIWVDFKGSSGCCQKGKRPAVVVQNNTGNKFSTTTTVVPITSREKTNLPVHTKLTKDYDIAHEGNIIMAEQITVIDKSQILSVGKILDDVDMKFLDRAMFIQLSLVGNIA